MTGKLKKVGLRSEVFFPAISVVGMIVLVGIFKPNELVSFSKNGFELILRNFGWLYQWTSIVALIIMGILTFSKIGNIKIGGKNAQPKFSFWTWFAMALAGGIGTGLIVYAGVNEPMIYFGNIYGELDTLRIEAFSKEAAIFSIARNFYNWTFFPYAIYSVSGILMAYVYFNKKLPLKVTSTLTPIFGEKAKTKKFSAAVDFLAILALVLGLASSMGAGLTLISSSLTTVYGIEPSTKMLLAICSVITLIFVVCVLRGMGKGIKILANFNTRLFYFLLIFLFLTGPTISILKGFTSGMAYWLDNFWSWGLDPIDIGGEALTMSWTLFDWSMWIAFAPLMGIFLAIISYGRTIRQFLIINWILPAVFGLVWISVWGETALNWQINGKVDLVNIIDKNGFVAGLWGFLTKVPFIGWLVIPLVIIALVVSFSTMAASMSLTLASLCSDELEQNQEPEKWHQITWGLFIEIISLLMIIFGSGTQGIDGIKYLAVIGGFLVFIVFLLQIASTIKIFFIDDIDENV